MREALINTSVYQNILVGRRGISFHLLWTESAKCPTVGLQNFYQELGSKYYLKLFWRQCQLMQCPASNYPPLCANKFNPCSLASGGIQNQKKRKMAWVSWDKLTLPKSAGGLGFREIEQFNDAMLAKLSWKILLEPNSLLSQVLLGKYCHNSSFLECSAPSSASHGWRGILAGREILYKGLGWSVGTGENINVWTEPWLSATQPLKPFGPPNLDSVNLRVSDLVYADSKTWNLSTIRFYIPQYEDLIRRILISSSSLPDARVWLPEKSGIYSTKSGYALAKLNTSPLSIQSFNWKSGIWKLQTSPKVKHFLWKVVTKSLPVGDALKNRGIEVDGLCKRCKAPESTIHLLLLCLFAAELWDLAPLKSKPSASTSITVENFLLGAKGLITLPPTGLSMPLYPWILWHFWKSRNQLMFEDMIISVQEVLNRAIADARSWMEAQRALPRPSLPTLSPPIQTHDLEVHACFVDGSNNIVRQNSANHEFIGSALIAETLAVKFALLDAISAGFRKLKVFSDCKVLISLLTTGNSIVALRSLLHDIRELSVSFTSLSFSFVPRLENVLADGLAKSALSDVTPSPFNGG